MHATARSNIALIQLRVSRDSIRKDLVRSFFMKLFQAPFSHPDVNGRSSAAHLLAGSGKSKGAQDVPDSSARHRFVRHIWTLTVITRAVPATYRTIRFSGVLHHSVQKSKGNEHASWEPDRPYHSSWSRCGQYAARYRRCNERLVYKSSSGRQPTDH